MVGANFVHFHSLSFPDHQSASYPSSAALQLDAMAAPPYPSDVGALGFTHVTKPNGWAAKSNWAGHEALIKQLYLYEKKPLADVMHIMESQHNFRATSVLHAVLFISSAADVRRVKMYKTHIKQWGLDKKNKEFEMRGIVRKNKQRADEGKGSIICVRGRLRNFAEVVRYWDRKGVSIDDIIARQTASPTPEAVEFFTPVPTPVLTPQVLATPERIFRCIRNYCEGSFDSGTWVRTEPFTGCYSIKDEQTLDSRVGDFGIQCISACELFSRDLFQEAGQTLIAATAKTKNILSAEYPENLTDLFRLIVMVRRRRRDEIALIILRQFSALGKVLLGSEHPLSRICEWIGSVYALNFDDIIFRCMESIVDQFERFVGPMHRSTLSFRLGSIAVVTEGNTRIQMVQKLFGECEKISWPQDFRIFQVRSWLAKEYLAESYHVEAMTLGQENMACSRHAQSMDASILLQSEGLSMVAKCQYALGEVDLGITNLDKAIALRMSRWGQQESRARCWLVYLEDWYLRLGDWSSAAQVRDWREKTLEAVDMD